MKKRIMSLILALTMCLSLVSVPAAAEGTYTRVLENMKFASDNQEFINSLNREGSLKYVEDCWYKENKDVSAVLTLDDPSFPSPYGLNLRDMKLTMSNFSANQVPSREGTQQYIFLNTDVTLRGSNKLVSGEREQCRFDYQTTIDGPGSLTVTMGTASMNGSTMNGGTLIVDKPACDLLDLSFPGLKVERSYGFIMNGGELIVKNGGSADQYEADMRMRPSAAIAVYGNLTITGGRVYADPGKDVRDGYVPPCAELKAEWGYEQGEAHIKGGVFNVGNLQNNTVLDLAVEPGYRVVLNNDPETMGKYPYAVQPDTEGLSIFPVEPTATKGKTLQMTYSGITSEPKIWGVTGNQAPGTAISETGLLTVAPEETAETLTVTVSAGALSDSTTVRVEPEYFDVWLMMASDLVAFPTIVLEKKRVEKGSTFQFPQVSEHPALGLFIMEGWMRHGSGNGAKMWKEGETSDPITRDMCFCTSLTMDTNKFAIEDQWYNLPEAGGCLNSAGGSQKTGSWWIEHTASGDVELTLNGVDLNKDGTRYSCLPGAEASLIISAPPHHELVVHVRNGENRIHCPEPQDESILAIAFYQSMFRVDKSVRFDIAPDSSLILEDSPDIGSKILLRTHKDTVHITGGGTMKIIPRSENCTLLVEDIVDICISDHSSFELDGTAVDHEAGDSSVMQNDAHYSVGDIIVEDGSSFLFKSGFYPLSSHHYDIGSMNARVGLFHETGRRDVMSQDSLNKYRYGALYIEINKDIPAPTETIYPLIVAGKQVTESNRSDILGDGKVSYDCVTNTLTLNSATVQPPAGDSSHPSQYSALYYYGDETLNIVNSGLSYLNGRSGGTDSVGITYAPLSADNGILVDGDGTLRCSGWTGADRSYGCLALGHGGFIVANKIEGVAVEFRGSSRPFTMDYFTAQRSVVSDHMDGSAPRLCDREGTDLETVPFLALYNVIPHDFYAAYNGSNKISRLQTPLHVNTVKEKLDFDLQAGAYDQYGLETDYTLDQNLITWDLYPGDSANPETVKKYMDQGILSLDKNGRLQYTVQGYLPGPPTYVCALMTYTPRGIKKSFPVLILHETQDPKITVQFKPDVPKRIYRAGDDFDTSTIDVTVAYDDYGPDSDNGKYRSVFLLTDPEIVSGTDMPEGTYLLAVEYYDPVHKKEYRCPFTIDPVLGRDYIMMAPDGKHIEVTSQNGSTLIIADYTDGRMTAVRTYDIPTGTEDKSYALSGTERAFLLKQNGAPACSAVSGQN